MLVCQVQPSLAPRGKVGCLGAAAGRGSAARAAWAEDTAAGRGGKVTAAGASWQRAAPGAGALRPGVAQPGAVARVGAGLDASGVRLASIPGSICTAARQPVTRS